ncbi:MAG: PAS domain S-box protein [Bacteroidetes bacterium]|nr:PAS domain S-box protein [Bacteroidota bacterium]MBU1114910.1 PAS domain S-box protein [Bacteroidota bacterium]MBU1799380.1 PAS domain S-box protein [Bacteroidota bacterium]
MNKKIITQKTDCTKKTQSKFEENEERYKVFVDNSIDAFYLTDFSGKLLDVNKAACTILGYSREELLKLTVSDIDIGFTKKQILEFIKNLEFNVPIIVNSYHKRKNGEIFPIEARINTFGTKEKPFLISNVRDMTEQKENEELLRKSFKKYQDLFEKSKDAILIIKNGRFVDCNQAAVELLLYKDKSQLLNFYPSELSPEFQPDGRNSVEKADELMKIAVEKGSHRFEWEHVKSNGEIFPVEVLLTTITNEDGSQVLHTTWRDISERKKDEKLQKALYAISQEADKASSINELYKSLHEIVSTLMPAKNFFIAIHNSETNIVDFPYFFDEYDPSPVKRIFSNGLTEKVLKSKKSQIIKRAQRIKKTAIIKSTGHYPKQWVGIYLGFEGKYKGVLAIQDYENENAYNQEHLKILNFVSEQIVKTLDKRYADETLRKSVIELMEAKKQLEIINRDKNRLFSIISHDLKSPFMTLLGISQMISEDMDSMSVKEVKEMTSTIYNSTQNLYKLIENLLNWSRLQMDSFQVTPTKLNIKDIYKSVRTLVKLSAEEKGILINDKLPKVFVLADEDCVKTVFRNLIGNAIKYTEPKGTITISCKKHTPYIEISVEDTGVGMNKKLVNKLFSISEVISKKGTLNETGTGLGLIICKELIEKNNGKLWVESELGKGSKFIFTLPMH